MKAMFAEIDGVKTPRPEGQDIRPKVFDGKPWPLAIIDFSEPTDRYVLWFISNYKYAFNVFYTSDFSQWMKPPEGDVSKWPLSKYLVVVKSLSDRNLIEFGDKQRLTYKVTLKGQLYRLTTHPQWILLQLLIAALLAFLVAYSIVIINRSSQSTQVETESEKGKSVLTTSDSAQYKPAQILPVKDSGSFLNDSDKTKTKLVDTVGIKRQVIKSTKHQQDKPQ